MYRKLVVAALLTMAIVISSFNLTFLPVFLLGGVGGSILVWLWTKKPEKSAASCQEQSTILLDCLLQMGDALQEVSKENLQRRGGWDRTLFDDVLSHVEQQTPLFQAALIAYLGEPQSQPPDLIAALLGVDRLSAAYTYWTRLFPPRKQNEALFVLSLLQDLSDRVEHAIQLLGVAHHPKNTRPG